MEGILKRSLVYKLQCNILRAILPHQEVIHSPESDDSETIRDGCSMVRVSGSLQRVFLLSSIIWTQLEHLSRLYLKVGGCQFDM